MAKVIFSFDTEDYINPGVDDFTRRICEVFDAHSLTASFMLVAERARVLVARGRMDVIEALSRHEIGYHSYYHSLHPNVSEYLDEIDDWSQGVAEFLAQEHEGVSLVRQVFGRHRLWAAVPAGYSWAPQMVYGYAKLGIPIQSGSALIPPRNHPYHYLNQLHLDYNLRIDRQLLGEWDAIPAAFDARLDAGAEYIVTCDHPTILLHSQYVDAINFMHGRNPPRHEWQPAPERPREHWERALSNMDRMLQYVIDHPDLEPCTYESVADRFEEPPGATADRLTVMAVAEHAVRGELRSVELGGTSFSVADQFGVLNHAVAHADNRTIPDTAPLRRLLGPTGDVAGNADPFAAPLSSVIQAALDVERDLHRHIPVTIPVGPQHATPGTFLQGLAQLVASTAAGTPTDPIPFDPAPPLPAEAELEGLRDLTWHNRWDIFPPDFTGETLQRHAKRQTWTIRPAVARP